METFDPLQLKMLSDIHYALEHHQSLSSVQIFFLSCLMLIPGPLSWRMEFFNFFYKNHIDFYTIMLVIGMVIGLIIVIVILIKLLLKIFSVLYQKNLSYTILSVKPPYDATKSTFTMSQFITTLHAIARLSTWWESFLKRKKLISCELVSTKKEGIRYILRVPSIHAAVVEKALYGYLPGVIIEKTKDYLPARFEDLAGKKLKIIKLKLYNHFLLPLQKHNALSQHDPIAFITAQMTKLSQGDLMAMQIILTPVLDERHKKVVDEINRMNSLVHHGFDVTQQINNYHKDFTSKVLSVVRFLLALIIFYFLWPFFVFFFIITLGRTPLFPTFSSSSPKSTGLSREEQHLQELVKQKIDENLFEVTIRLCLINDKAEDQKERLGGFYSSLSIFENIHQGFDVKRQLPLISKLKIFQKLTFLQYKYRLLALKNNPIFSVTEVSSLYHFPYATTTKTEGLVKVHSRELPSPLSLKQEKELDVIFGTNTYGGENTAIGLTDDERSRHVYMIGQTGSGKSTIIYHMAKDDIQKGRGVAVIDPHGDLAEDILVTVPKKRAKDFIYFNPFDIKHPVGINLLELTSGLDDDELELEKELVAEGVVSIFRRVFSNDETTNAHRIEYILRNAIYTAFTIEKRTIFTVYELLNNHDFRKKVVKDLEDENLKSFWKSEFDKAGNYQIVKMISGVTAKVGRFLFSPTAKRILEQERSTINFDEILDQGKILLCNLSEGKLGEDTSQLLGTTIITKIHQAALRRSRNNPKNRKPFYLFVDEFQNFATTSFTKLLSGGRKFGLRVTIAEQSTAQQTERNIVDVILANTGTVICFRTASPVDEELLLHQFSPYVEKGELALLPRYRFYIKLGALEPEEPFSGHTLPIESKRNKKLIETLIEESQKRYASTYVKKEKPKVVVVQQSPKQDVTKKTTKTIQTRSGAPV